MILLSLKGKSSTLIAIPLKMPRITYEIYTTLTKEGTFGGYGKRVLLNLLGLWMGAMNASFLSGN